jgi:hypothetical protein
MIGQALLGIGVRKQQTFTGRRSAFALARCCDADFRYLCSLPRDEECPVLLDPSISSHRSAILKNCRTLAVAFEPSHRSDLTEAAAWKL